jgi:hypothetical protein
LHRALRRILAENTAYNQFLFRFILVCSHKIAALPEMQHFQLKKDTSALIVEPVIDFG